MRTKAKFVESLRKQKPKVYLHGEKVENIVDHPMFRIPIDSVGIECDLINNPKYQDLTTKISPLINGRISRWYALWESAEDLIAFQHMLRELTPLFVCIPGCEVTSIINAIWVATYDVDKIYNTNYHDRLTNYLKYVQENGIMLTGAITDVRGDRSKRPSEQADPDMYLHVVERRKDGIVVRGAKASNTGGPVANEIFAMPTRTMREDEKDFCVAFAIPVDTEGVIFLARTWGAPEAKGEIDQPLSRRFGLCEATTFFDNVFVPWDRVFLCGEAEGSESAINTFIQNRGVFCGCRAGRIDAIIGAAALIAEYNGVSQASHIRRKITEMIIGAETVYALAYTAATAGTQHPSGVFSASSLEANVGRLLATYRLSECFPSLMDITGGLIVTSPFEEELKNPETKKYVDKYLKAKPDVPAEHRLRLIKYIEDMVAGKVGDWMLPESILGSGPPENQMIDIWNSYDLEKRKRIAKLNAGIIKE